MKKIQYLAFLLCFLRPYPLFAQCAPVNAQVCESGDDTTQVWVNGSYIGSKEYCDLRSGCSPEKLCLPVPLDKLTGPQVCLAIETTNVNPVLVFSSWELEVDCAGGKPFVVNNENTAQAAISLYWDPTGGSSCGLGNSPPVDDRGHNWTDLNYNPASNPFTFTGMPVTINTWTCAQIKNADTGIVLPYISYDGSAAGSGPGKACGVLYWRQIAQLPARVPTSTPTVVFTATPSKTSTPTRTPWPTWTPTFTPTPFPTFTPTWTPRYRHRLTPTPLPTPKPVKALPHPPRRVRIKPTPTFAPLRPTPTPRLVIRPTFTPTLPPPPPRPTPRPAWIPPPVKGQELIFQTLPFEVYMTFEDGPGRYQLEVVDESGRPLRMVFDGKIVGEKDTWVNWDGKDSRGQAVQPGHYYLVFYKDGKAIKSISVYLTGQGGH